MRLRLLPLVLVLSFTAPLANAQSTPPRAGFADLIDKLSPAVVNVSTTQKVKSGGVQMFGDLPNTPEMAPFKELFERFGQQQQQQGGGQQQEREVTSLGSGFIIDPTGFVITNNHVIDDAEQITVTLPNNDKYKAKIIGRDKKVDLALLKIEAKKPLPFVPMGDSDSMRVGDWVIAIGNPYGLGGTVTQGIISARQRSINSGPFDDFLQTDAPINRGNSGGPLFNMSGEVIGINTAIFSPGGANGGSIGIGFAIPTSLAKPVISQLKEFGRTHRGWLGVKIQMVSEEMADSLGLDHPHGALILDVTPGGPAAKAGLQAGDVVTNFGGKEISEMRFLPRIVAETKIGTSADITYVRKGKPATTSIKVGELDEKDDDKTPAKAGDKQGEDESPAGTSKFLGMELTPLSPELRQQLHLKESVKGLVLLGMTNDSPALRRGLQRGDVIIETNGESTIDIASVKKQFAAAKTAGHKFTMLKVIRNGEAAFVTLPVE